METAREAIILAAMKGVRLYGLHGVRIRHISDLAGVLPSSIYGYFNGKEDLMQACFSHISDRLAAMISQSASVAGDLDAAERRRCFWNGLFRWFVQNPDETLFFYRFCDRPDMAGSTIFASSCFDAYCTAMNLFPGERDTDPRMSWLHMVLGTAHYAGYVIRGVLPETDNCSSQIYNCIFE